MTVAAPKSNAFVLTATDHGPMLVNRFDYCADSAWTWGVGHDLLNTSSYEADMIKILVDLLTVRRELHGDGVMVIDCGANVGAFTLPLARHILGWGKLLAFEAQERVFYVLAGNIAINNLFNARALWTALGEAPGAIEIPIIDYLQPASFGSLELMASRTNEDIGQALDRSPGHGQVVAMTTIDELDLPRIDLIKMDVEGMELQVLRGGLRSLRRSRPMMLLEHGKTSLADLTEFLTRENYRVIETGRNLVAIHRDDPVSDRVKSGQR
jgi:FkbM family methyltransferase